MGNEMASIETELNAQYEVYSWRNNPNVQTQQE